MGLSRRPMSVTAVLASILAVIMPMAQAPLPPIGVYTGDRCDGYNGVEGTCMALFTCPILEQEAKLLSIPEFIARHGPNCDYDFGKNKLLCCPRNSTEIAVVSGCEKEGGVYPEGHVKLDECFPIQCVNGTSTAVIQHTTGNKCVPPFESYEGVCYHYNTSRVTWCQARHRCWDIQAELAIATDRSNYNALKAFNLLKHQSGFGAWVGVRNLKWLNGPEADRNYQWRFRQPDGDGECGFMGHGGLWDYACDYTLPYICQLF